MTNQLKKLLCLSSIFVATVSVQISAAPSVQAPATLQVTAVTALQAKPVIAPLAQAFQPASIRRQVSFYVFGDSYASGEGAMQFTPGTNTTTNQCHRAETAYGPLIAKRFRLELGRNFFFPACSGATTNNIYREGQFDELAQVFNVEPVPAKGRGVVALSVGGNDLGFASVLQYCLLNQETYSGNPLDLDNLSDLIDCQRATPTNDPGSIFLEQLNENLENVAFKVADNIDVIFKYLGQIRGSIVDVHIVGYPDLFNDEVEVCGNGTIELEPGIFIDALLSKGERKYFNQTSRRLNARLRKVADAHRNVHFIDVNRYFQGHRICDEKPYINPITFPTHNSAHPNEMGHRSMYYAVGRALVPYTFIY